MENGTGGSADGARIRAALHVVPGDLIAWEVGTDGTATVRRVQPMDIEYCAPSLFTLDHRLVRGEIGKLSPADAELVRAGLTELLGGPTD